MGAPMWYTVPMSDQTKMKKKITLRDILILQGVVMIYSLSGVTAKFASGETFLSLRFILFYALEIVILGVYAVLWQQVIKRTELSVAYANRAMALVWSVIWALAIFRDQVNINNLIGIILVIIGTVLINSETEDAQ